MCPVCAFAECIRCSCCTVDVKSKLEDEKQKTLLFYEFVISCFQRGQGVVLFVCCRATCL